MRFQEISPERKNSAVTSCFPLDGSTPCAAATTGTLVLHLPRSAGQPASPDTDTPRLGWRSGENVVCFNTCMHIVYIYIYTPIICIYIYYIYIYIYLIYLLYTYIYIYTYLHLYYLYIYIYTYIYSLYIYIIYIFICMCIHIYIYVCLWMCVCECVCVWCVMGGIEDDHRSMGWYRLLHPASTWDNGVWTSRKQAALSPLCP